DIPARRPRDHLKLLPLVRRRAPQPRQRQEPDLPVLTPLRDERRGEIDRRRGAEIGVGVIQLLRVRGRVVPDQLPRRREYEYSVAPVGAAVPWRVARCDEKVAAARDDDRAGATPGR